MRVAVIVQARMGSKRFPGKVLADLNGKPVLWHVLTRARKIAADAFVLAIPLSDRSALHGIARDCDFWTFGMDGDENDVLARYYRAAEVHKADVIVRITGDCPLINPVACNELIAEFKRTDADYLSNVFPERKVASGLDCEVFTFDALRATHDNVTDPYDREHVTPWMQRMSQQAILGPKMSIDTPEDLARVREFALHA